MLWSDSRTHWRSLTRPSHHHICLQSGGDWRTLPDTAHRHAGDRTYAEVRALGPLSMKHGFTDWVTWGQPYLRINHPCWTFDGHGISNLEFENDPRFKMTGRKEAEFCSVYNIWQSCWFSNLRSLKTWDLKSFIHVKIPCTLPQEWGEYTMFIFLPLNFMFTL